MEENKDKPDMLDQLGEIIYIIVMPLMAIYMFINICTYPYSEDIPVTKVTYIKEEENYKSTIVIEKAEEYIYDYWEYEGRMVDCMLMYTSTTIYDLSSYSSEEKQELENEIKEKEKMYEPVRVIEYSIEYKDNTIKEIIVQESKRQIDRLHLRDNESIGTVEETRTGKHEMVQYIEYDKIAKELEDSGYTIESIEDGGTYHNIN